MDGFAVLGVVQPLDLLVPGDAQARGELADHQDDEGAGRAPGDDANQADGLFPHRGAIGQGVDGRGGEQAGQQGADDAADAVARKYVEGVIE